MSATTVRQEIEAFWGSERLAVIGVARDPKEFGHKLFTDLRQWGYDAVPVSPNLTAVGDVPALRAGAGYRLEGRRGPVADVARLERADRARLRRGRRAPRVVLWRGRPLGRKRGGHRILPRAWHGSRPGLLPVHVPAAHRSSTRCTASSPADTVLPQDARLRRPLDGAVPQVTRMCRIEEMWPIRVMRAAASRAIPSPSRESRSSCGSPPVARRRSASRRASAGT